MSFITKYPPTKNWLIEQVGYYSKKLYKFNEGDLVPFSASIPKFIILAKCHYSESWQAFTSVNKKELDKILALKKESVTSSFITFQAFNNDAIDGFDVKIVRIEQSLIDLLGKEKVYIPETELFIQTVANHLLQINTFQGKVFCASIAGKVKASYAKGIINNVDTYKLSIGLPADVQAISVTKEMFPRFLLSQLFSVNLAKILKVSSFDIKSWINPIQLHLLYCAPLVTALCFYVFFNGYLFFKTSSLEHKIKEGGQQVSEAFVQKRELDNNLTVLSMLSNEFPHRNFVHYHWQIIEQLLVSGMKITRINFKGNELIVRGMANKASAVLTDISSHEQVTSASFQGAVRKSSGKDSFILTLKIKDS